MCNVVPMCVFGGITVLQKGWLVGALGHLVPCNQFGVATRLITRLIELICNHCWVAKPGTLEQVVCKFGIFDLERSLITVQAPWRKFTPSFTHTVYLFVKDPTACYISESGSVCNIYSFVVEPNFSSLCGTH
jgi:hypothetical protein